MSTDPMVEEPPTRTFPTGAVLSATTGILLCEIDDVFEMLGFILGEIPQTYEAPEALDAVAPDLFAQFPWIAHLPDPPVVGAGGFTEWLAAVVKDHGETLDVVQPTTVPPGWTGGVFSTRISTRPVEDVQLPEGD